MKTIHRRKCSVEQSPETVHWVGHLALLLTGISGVIHRPLSPIDQTE